MRAAFGAAALLATVAVIGAMAPSASARPIDGVVQVPITAVTPVQVCNNNVAAGLIAVAVDALTGKYCQQDDVGVVNDAVDRDDESS